MARTAVTYPFGLVFGSMGRPLTVRPVGYGMVLPVFSLKEEAEPFCVGTGSGRRRVRVGTAQG